MTTSYFLSTGGSTGGCDMGGLDGVGLDLYSMVGVGGECASSPGLLSLVSYIPRALYIAETIES